MDSDGARIDEMLSAVDLSTRGCVVRWGDAAERVVVILLAGRSDHNAMFVLLEEVVVGLVATEEATLELIQGNLRPSDEVVFLMDVNSELIAAKATEECVQFGESPPQEVPHQLTPLSWWFSTAKVS